MIVIFKILKLKKIKLSEKKRRGCSEMDGDWELYCTCLQQKLTKQFFPLSIYLFNFITISIVDHSSSPHLFYLNTNFSYFYIKKNGATDKHSSWPWDVGGWPGIIPTVYLMLMPVCTFIALHYYYRYFACNCHRVGLSSGR